MRDDSWPKPEDKIRTVICLGATEHEIACLSDALTSNFPRNRAFPSSRTPRIGRTLAGHMMGMAADISSSSPEARWQSIFGNSYIGATFTHVSDWVVLADDDGQPHPNRLGRLVQLIFPHHLPVAFTSSAEQSAKPGSVQRRLRGCDRYRRHRPRLSYDRATTPDRTLTPRHRTKAKREGTGDQPREAARHDLRYRLPLPARAES
jgi:hypothetical protein